MREALGRASQGEPSAVILVGDAGIGKSRLAREAVAYAESIGMQICHGRFIEGGVVPYLPWSGALLPRLERAHLLDPAVIGGHAEVLRQLIDPAPGFRTQETSRDHEARILVALAASVAALASQRPLLFIIDDLHWAEAGGLNAFLHLVLTLSDSHRDQKLPICAIATTRPPEPASALAQAVARMAREPILRVTHLHPLDELELNELFREAVAAPCSPSLLHELARTTGGNPLLLEETLRHLSQIGKLVESADGVALSGEVGDTPLPAGISEAIEARMHALSPECSRLLSLAAMVGDEFSPRLLETIAERDEEHVLSLLEEAYEAHFVVDQDSGFRFAHPIIRRVFEQHGSAARRRRTHLWIAERLAEPGTAGAASPMEIATHWLTAGNLAPEAARGTWATRAGDHAMNIHAWAEAARYYDAALALPGYLASLSASERARIAFGAGVGHQRAMEPQAARARFEQAIDLSSEAGDLEGWGRALAQWMRVVNGHGSVALGMPANGTRFEAFMEAVGSASPASLGWVFENWAEALYISGDPGAETFAASALEMGKSTNDVELCALAANAIGLSLQRSLAFHGALERFAEADAYGKQCADPWYQSWPLQAAPGLLAALGRLDEAEEVVAEGSIAAARAANWSALATLEAARAHIAATRGDFLHCDEAAAEAQTYLNRSDHSITPIVLGYTVAAAKALRGEWEGALDAVEMIHASGGSRASWLLQQLVTAASGDRDAARAEISARPGWAFWQGRADMFSLPLLCQRMELADELDLPELARVTTGPLDEAVRAGVVFCTSGPYLLRRALGVGYRLEGRLDEAEYVLERAIDEARAAVSRTELARCQYEMGRVLLARAEGPDVENGVASLVAAAVLAHELGMHPLRERARAELEQAGATVPAMVTTLQLSETETDVLVGMARGESTQATADRLLLSTRTVERAKRRLASELGIRGRVAANAYAETHGLSLDSVAEGPRLLEEPPAPRAGRLRVLMFSDIVDSTPLNEALGDQRYYELLSRHDQIVHGAIRRNGGVVVKHTGDGVFASFDSAGRALATATEMTAAFPICLDDLAEHPLAIRVGLHAGEPVTTDSDLFGLAVTLTRRICDRAPDGRVLVSEPLRVLAEGTGHRFQTGGSHSLKGLSQEYEVYELLGASSGDG